MIVNFIKKIIKRLKRPKTEIEYVEAALKRYQARLDLLNSKFNPKYDCCHTCAFPEYPKLVSKIERVEHWLKVLKTRKNKHGMASKSYK